MAHRFRALPTFGCHATCLGMAYRLI